MPKKRAAHMADDKREKIMAAALQEFADHSFQAASLNEIIRRSGVSKGVVYYYFECKEDLFLTTLQGCSDELAQAVTGLWLEGIDQREEYWLQAARCLERFAEQLAASPLKALFWGRVSEAFARGEAAVARPLLHAADEWVHERLVEGQIVGAVRRDLPLELLVQLTWETLRSLLAWFISDTKAQRINDASRCAAAMLDTLQRLCVPHDMTRLPLLTSPARANPIPSLHPASASGG